MKLASAALTLGFFVSGGFGPACAGQFRTAYSFKGIDGSAGSHTDGAVGCCGLLNVGGRLYGVTEAGGRYNGGTVFTLNPVTGAERVLHAFGATASDGQAPIAGLIDIGGTLYGTTGDGGVGKCDTYGEPGCGTVFAVSAKTGAERLVYTYQVGSGGSGPDTTLVSAGGKLYGTTLGNPKQFGTVFTVDTEADTQTVIYAFAGGADGSKPVSLISMGGKLYGTTMVGGTDGNGVLFEIDPATGAESVVYAFKGGRDGKHPSGNLIKLGGMLLGTTSEGGSANCKAGCGTVFTVDPATGGERVLYAFGGQADGTAPNGLISVGDALFGTTFGEGVDVAGTGNVGTLFRLDQKTGLETVLHSFTEHDDGGNPSGGLIYVGNTLYGTTQDGGVIGSNPGPCKFGCGTVFAYTP